MTRANPKIGIALGSGSARGWSHIGVLRALERAGISPDIVCGTSIGALVGAAYAAGELDRLEAWVRELKWPVIAGLVDLSMDGGLVKGDRIIEFFRSRFPDREIPALPRAWGAVATELATGREVWLREGSVIDAVRASIALPGLFAPARQDGRLLVDGGLVNPVPVSLCRAMGADIVIAVDLNWDLVGRQFPAPPGPSEAARDETQGPLAGLLEKLPAMLGRLRSGPRAGPEMPSVLDVLTASLNIMQVRITRSRLSGEPADVMIRPRLADIAAMDYHRAAQAIEAGVAAADRVSGEIRELAHARNPYGAA